ncbi:hypothetical protein L9F63_014697, partial [Diploptera punctata]
DSQRVTLKYIHLNSSVPECVSRGKSNQEFLNICITSTVIVRVKSMGEHSVILMLEYLTSVNVNRFACKEISGQKLGYRIYSVPDGTVIPPSIC